MVHLTEDSFVHAVWFVALPDSLGDWMATLLRDGPDQPDYVIYRFRWYRDQEAFGSDDEKVVFRVNFGDPRMTLEQKIESIDLVVQGTFADQGVEVDRTIVNGNAAKFVEVLRDKPWANFRELPKPS